MSDLQESQHESFRLPTNNDIPIWRYMDFAKYLWMLDRQSLFFARATTLGDPFEGASTKAMIVSRDYIKANRQTDPNLAAYKDLPDAVFSSLPREIKRLVRSFLLNCWHMNEHESAAMWKLYSNSGDAVCIQSTYRRLRQCLPRCVLIGEVNYINYETQEFDSSNAFTYIMHKRLSFAHERELRAVFWEMDSSDDAQLYNEQLEPDGLAIEINLAALVERVYVSPAAASWFASFVKAITAKYGFSFPVSQSALAAVPLF